MLFEKNDIVTFKDLEDTLSGVIQGQEGEYLHIKGLNGKTYFRLPAEIINIIGKSRVNESRKNAEAWELDKSKNPTYEDAKAWEENKKLKTKNRGL